MKLKPAHLLTGAIFVMVLAYAMAKCLLSVVMSDMIDEFALQGSTQGFLSSASSTGALCSLLSMFLLQGRVSKKTMLALSALLLMAVLCVIGLTSSFPMLLLLLLMQGAAMGYLEAYMNAMVVDLNGDQSGPALNLLHVFFGIGGLGSAFAVQAVAQSTGWRASYFLIAAVVLCALLLFLWMHRKRSSEAGAVKELSFSPRDAAAFFSDRINLLLLLSLLLYCSFQSGAFTWLSRYITTELSAPQYAAVGLGCYWAGTITCRLLSARSKLDPIKRLLVGMFLAGAAHCTGILMHSVLSVCLGTLLLGLAGGLCVPTLTNAIARHNVGRTALASSCVSIMNFTAGILMPVMMASLAGVTSLHTAMLLPGAAAVLAGCALAVYHFFLREKHAA